MGYNASALLVAAGHKLIETYAAAAALMLDFIRRTQRNEPE